MNSNLQHDYVSEQNKIALLASRKNSLRNPKAETTWDYFLDLRSRANFSPIVDPSSELLRDYILLAALKDATRLAVFFLVAQHLRDELDFEWPELYARIVHHFLGHADYDAARLWHLRLMPTFTPSAQEFGALLASFAVDPTRQLQFVLKQLYSMSPIRQIYNHLIPTLFEYGQSQTARKWRKFLISYKDVPSPQTSRSRPFLKFCNQYYPKMPLLDEEWEILDRRSTSSPKLDKQVVPKSRTRGTKAIYGDSFTARWFASSWASIEFGINLMHRLGLKTIGPRSLQSLALRESDAESVTNHIVQIEKLGITVARTTYCSALVMFAKEGRDDLLTALVNCDIHPEEFDDLETLGMLKHAAYRQQDKERVRLLEEIETAILGQSSEKDKQQPPRRVAQKSQEFNRLLKNALHEGTDFARGRLILDKMESANVELSQPNALKILEHVFQELYYFPKKDRQQRFGRGRDPILERAIQVTRQVSRHDIAVPTRYWRVLLYNLGRLGRFQELEELSHEIVDLYACAPNGLIPVHPHDMPPKPGPNEDLGRSSSGPKHTEHDDDGWPMLMDEFWKTDTGLGGSEDSRRPKCKGGEPWSSHQQHIPSDLPVTHQDHPLAKLFDAAMQRSIVRWTFDQKLALPAHPNPSLNLEMAPSIEFDMASGVRYLATLRDRGLHIDVQVLRSSLYSRIILAQVPGRGKHRSRDERELAPASLKRLVDDAWGSELFPPLPLFVKDLEEQRPSVWRRYPRLFMHAYDREGFREGRRERNRDRKALRAEAYGKR